MHLKKILLTIGIIFLLTDYSFASEVTTSEYKINYLHDLNKDSVVKHSQLLANTPQEITYLKKMLSLSEKKDSTYLQGLILSLIVKNYYNRFMVDSARYWIKKVEKVTLENKQYRYFFDSYNLYCSLEVYLQNYDVAIEHANRLYLMAKDINNIDGLIASYENLGIIYMETFRYVEAIKSFKEGLELQSRQKSKRYGYEFQFTSYIIESYLKLKDFRNVEKNIEQAYLILDNWKKKNNNIPLKRCLWLLDSYKIEMYVVRKMPEKAKEYIDEAKINMKNVNDLYVYYYYYYVSALYNQLIENYPQALDDIAKILCENDYLPAIQLKAKILLESKKYKESALVYEKALNIVDTTYNESISKQINQLRTIHEVDKLELKNKELEIESRNSKLRLVWALAGLFLFISIISIIYNIRIRIIRNKLRISDKLLKEDKKKLIKSEHDLLIAKEKAELSSKYKDIFLANMSHEVRTPLNAIIGFSSVLTELYDNNECKEYVSIIRKNSDLLLKLINDTVDASSLQTGQLKFEFDRYEVRSMCQSLAEELKIHVSNDIVFKFIPDEKECYLFTDEIRLKQLLRNLLINSMKFTSNGEICLKYIINEDSIEFIVEDTGSGIPKEKQEEIFESFQKVDTFSQGIGLGLTLTKLIADKLDGKIIIDSTYTFGTRMIFIHPIK